MKKNLLFCLMISLAFGCKKDISSDVLNSDNNASVTSTEGLQLVFEDSIYELTGIAVSAAGRMFTNYPLWNQPHKYDVVEINSVNGVSPYPNLQHKI